MDKFANVGWIEMLLMTLIGFGVVFCVLVLLIFVMKGMGAAFTRQKKAKKIAKDQAYRAKQAENKAKREG
jgi:sodium pump decarboxylase gamma subunit